MKVFLSVFSNFWIWKTVAVITSHDFCQRISWKIAKGNVWAKFHIPTGCGRCINKGFQKLPNYSHRENLNFSIKGSVERSLLPSAIFLIFTWNRSWKSEDHLCMLFFIEMSKERLEKSERIPPVSWRPWALAYSRDRPYNFSCLSAMSKNGRLHSFSSALGCHFARKSLSWPATSVSNKKQEFEQRKRIKLFDGFWVRAYWFDSPPPPPPWGAGHEHGWCKQSIFSLSIFGILVERLSFSRLHFCSDLVTVFLLSSSMQGLKYVVPDFLISTCEKSYASSKPTG